jgi:hypothetical protein
MIAFAEWDFLVMVVQEVSEILVKPFSHRVHRDHRGEQQNFRRRRLSL